METLSSTTVEDSSHTCGICYQQYNENDRVARVLSCGHTYCSSCLTSIVHHNPGVFPDCPSCRRKTRASVRNIPVNFQLMQVLRKHSLSDPNAGEAETSGAGENGAEEEPLGTVDDIQEAQQEAYDAFTKVIESLKTLVKRRQRQLNSERPFDYLTESRIESCESCIARLERQFDDFCIEYENAASEGSNRAWYREFANIPNVVINHDLLTPYVDSASDLSANDAESEDFEDADFRTDYAEDNSDVSSEIRRDAVDDLNRTMQIGSLFPLYRDDENRDEYRTYTTNDEERTTLDLISNWSDGVETDRFSEIFDDHTLPSGGLALKCRICDCQVPVTGEDTHIRGRRHVENVHRRLNNLPIITHAPPPPQGSYRGGFNTRPPPQQSRVNWNNRHGYAAVNDMLPDWHAGGYSHN